MPTWDAGTSWGVFYPLCHEVAFIINYSERRSCHPLVSLGVPPWEGEGKACGQQMVWCPGEVQVQVGAAPPPPCPSVSSHGHIPSCRDTGLQVGAAPGRPPPARPGLFLDEVLPAG